MGDSGGICPDVAPGGLKDDWAEDDDESFSAACCCCSVYALLLLADPETAVAVAREPVLLCRYDFSWKQK